MVAFPLAAAVRGIACELDHRFGVAVDTEWCRRQHHSVGERELNRAVIEPVGAPAAFVESVVVVAALCRVRDYAGLVGSCLVSGGGCVRYSS